MECMCETVCVGVSGVSEQQEQRNKIRKEQSVSASYLRMQLFANITT